MDSAPTPAGLRRAEVVADLSQRALATDDLDDLLAAATAAVADCLDAAACGVFERTPDGERVRLRAAEGWPDDAVGATAPLDPDSTVGRALRAEEPVAVDRAGTDGEPGVPLPLQGPETACTLGAPIRVDGGAWGALELRAAESRPFTDAETGFVGRVADVLGAAVENYYPEADLGEVYGRISDAFFALDEEWRFTYLNERAHELINPDGEELVGKRVWEEFPAAVSREFKRQYEHAMYEQEAVTFEEYYPEPLDAWFEVSAYPSETGVSVYFQDVTERKRREARLERLVDELEASNERLEQFAYAASHDLQEPLRMVSSYLRLLEDRYADELDEEAEEFIEYAVDGAERMREMIDGLLEYARVESRGDPFEPVDLNEVVDAVRRDLEVRIAESGAEISVDDLPRVEGDPDQLRQVFQNLLDNAVEYSGDEPPVVDVSAERRGDEWAVTVSDEGVGIDPAEADRVFEVFERLHAVDDHAGTGIGLALCRRIVERHGGDIRVEAEPGEGAAFTFTLPAVDDAG